SCRLKLVRLPLSLAATLAALPSMSEIPFLDSWLTSCARHRTREHCALSAMLTVSQLSKSFAGRALFDDVSLQVNRGDRIGLVGPNGAGKSTLFALLLGRPLLGISNGAYTISLLNATTGAIWSNRNTIVPFADCNASNARHRASDRGVF